MCTWTTFTIRVLKYLLLRYTYGGSKYLFRQVKNITHSLTNTHKFNMDAYRDTVDMTIFPDSPIVSTKRSAPGSETSEEFDDRVDMTQPFEPRPAQPKSTKKKAKKKSRRAEKVQGYFYAYSWSDLFTYIVGNVPVVDSLGNSTQVPPMESIPPAEMARLPVNGGKISIATVERAGLT